MKSILSSRERFIKTLNNEDPGDVVVDMGSTCVTGIQAHALIELRKHLGLDISKIKVYEPFQLLGYVDDDLRKALGVDILGIDSGYTAYGYKNENWKPWKLPSGESVLVGAGFETKVEANGNEYIYPCGDRNASPSAFLLPNGYFFNNIVRCFKEYEEGISNACEDFAEDFKILTDEQLRTIEKKANDLFNATNYGLVLTTLLTAMGDMGFLQGPALKYPKGIRKPDEWLMAHYLAPQYVHDCYEMQAEVAIENLKLLYEAVGDKAQTILVSGTDLGTQNAQYISNDMYREFYLAPIKKVTSWIHKNTNWKTFFHSCGSIINLLPELYEAGCDIINPVQCSAAGMDPVKLKHEWGNKFVFWGGGVDTQKTLPFGTPDEVYQEVTERLKIFAPGGGFVFNTVHNIQGNTEPLNLLAMFEAIKDYNRSISSSI